MCPRAGSYGAHCGGRSQSCRAGPVIRAGAAEAVVLKRFSLGFASLLWAAMALLAGPSETPERWRVLYFYDDLKTSLVINDFKFLDPKHGVAAGFLFDQKGKINPKAMLSDDGGVHWTFVALKETPLSLFFLNENHGWIVGERFIWQSADGGRTWNKLSELDGAVRVYFIDDEHGWAVGEEKSVWETDNGGKAWKEVPAAAAPTVSAERTIYNWIDFAGPRTGIITGWNQPASHSTSGVPEWMNPAASKLRRETPRVSIFLQTRDGGKTWSPGTG